VEKNSRSLQILTRTGQLNGRRALTATGRRADPGRPGEPPYPCCPLVGPGTDGDPPIPSMSRGMQIKRKFEKRFWPQGSVRRERNKGGTRKEAISIYPLFGPPEGRGTGGACGGCAERDAVAGGRGVRGAPHRHHPRRRQEDLAPGPAPYWSVVAIEEEVRESATICWGSEHTPFAGGGRTGRPHGGSVSSHACSRLDLGSEIAGCSASTRGRLPPPPGSSGGPGPPRWGVSGAVGAGRAPRRRPAPCTHHLPTIPVEWGKDQSYILKFSDSQYDNAPSMQFRVLMVVLLYCAKLRLFRR